MNDLSPLIMAMSTVAFILFAIGLGVLAVDFFRWIRRVWNELKRLRIYDRWHGEITEAQIKARKARAK